MARAQHKVVIGNGVAGSQAAILLRERDPDCRVTVISAGALMFYNRYELPDVFRGRQDWRDYLVYPPEFYQDNQITLRRKSIVSEIETANQTIVMAHREQIAYDQLLVATGGGGYLPERLQESAKLMSRFTTFRDAMGVFEQLPKGGRAIMLNGDMIGLDLARTLIDTGYNVTLVAGERTFWPHEIAPENRPKFLAALERMGIEVIDGREVARVEAGGKGKPPRRVVFDDKTDLHGDVVMPSYGLMPALDFMAQSGVDIERGLLVDTELRTTNKSIWAAGDVCQIWSEEEHNYRFYYGWKNVRTMGEVAARNMSGEKVPFTTDVSEKLVITKKGHIKSPFWEYE